MESSLRQESNFNIEHDNLRLVSNRVIVTEIRTVASKILFTPETHRDQAMTGIVVCLGRPQRDEESGAEQLQEVKIGDSVCFSRNVGIEMRWKGAKALLFREDEIQAVLIF